MILGRGDRAADQVLIHRDEATGEIHVRPLKREQLALPQPRAQCTQQQRMPASEMLLRHGEQVDDLGARQRLNLALRFVALPQILPHPQRRVRYEELVLDRLRQHQERLLRLIDALPWAGVADFLIEWAQDAIAVGREEVMATALGALIAFARNRRRGAGRLYGGWRIRQIRRNLPAWAYPEDEVVVVEREWTLDQFAMHIEPRLVAIAASERAEPKVAGKVIEEWRLEAGRA